MEEHRIDAAILAGDFNTTGGAKALSPLRELLIDTWVVAGLGWGGTMDVHTPVARIDQVWVTPNIETVSARVHKGPVSDHRYLVVDMILPAVGKR